MVQPNTDDMLLCSDSFAEWPWSMSATLEYGGSFEIKLGEKNNGQQCKTWKQDNNAKDVDVPYHGS